ncbi:MAG: hypothetical protein ABI407_03915 [Bradyrhizobium sp.]
MVRSAEELEGSTAAPPAALSIAAGLPDQVYDRARCSADAMEIEAGAKRRRRDQAPTPR